MNMNRLIGMILTPLIGIVVKKGVDIAANMGAGAKDDPNASPEQKAAAARAREQQAKVLSKRVKDAGKIIRRIK